MAGAVNWTLAEWLIIALILFSVLVEKVLHHIEHWIQHKHPPLQAVLRNVYRELMILGLVSFGFIMYIFIAEPGSGVKMTFEVAHVFIFLFAVFHTLVVSFTVYISLRLSSHWKRLERMDLDEFMKHKSDYQALHAVRSRYRSFVWRRLVWWVPDPRRMLRHSKIHEILAFHETRFQFIEWRSLPPDFRFAKFLRRIKSSIFLELVEIHWAHFAIFLIFLLLDIARSSLKLHPTTGPVFLMIGSVFNAIAVTFLAGKIRRIFWKMTKSPAIYCDNTHTGNTPAGAARLGSSEESEALDECVPKRINFEDDKAGAAKTDGAAKSSTKKKSVGFSVNDDAVEMSTDAKGSEAHHSEDRIETRSDRPSALSYMVAPASRMPKRVPEASQSSHEFDADLLGKTPTESKLPNTKAGASVESIQSAVAEQTSLQKLTTFRRVLKLDAMQRLQSTDDSDVKKGEEVKTPVSNYPSWVLKVVPRLGRVASPAEKLFWFGSHHFFMWCVGWVLFFSNINTAATIAKIAFLLKEKKSKYSSYPKSGAHFLLETVLRASASPKTSPKPSTEKRESLLLLLIALLIAVLVLFYVLFHIAGIMKKYIFVMNNANLLPESVTVDSIETVRLKDVLLSDITRQDDTAEGYKSEEEEEDYSQMRRNMSRFIRSDEAGLRDHGDA